MELERSDGHDSEVAEGGLSSELVSGTHRDSKLWMTGARVAQSWSTVI